MRQRFESTYLLTPTLALPRPRRKVGIFDKGEELLLASQKGEEL